MGDRYVVISVGCVECYGSSKPQFLISTDSFEKASALAKMEAKDAGHSGDAFVIRLSDGRIVAYDPDGHSWTERR